jgi:hypothetical protein
VAAADTARQQVSTLDTEVPLADVSLHPRQLGSLPGWDGLCRGRPTFACWINGPSRRTCCVTQG